MGKLNSFLTVPLFEKQIKTYEDILQSDLKISMRQYFSTMLQQMHYPHLDKMEQKFSSDAFPLDAELYLVSTQNIASISYRNPSLVLHGQMYDRSNGDSKFYELEKLISVFFPVLLMPKGHPLQLLINQILLRVHATGIPDKWIRDFLRVRRKKGSINYHSYQTLDLVYFLYAFEFLGVGYLVSMQVLMIEFIIKRDVAILIYIP